MVGGAFLLNALAIHPVFAQSASIEAIPDDVWARMQGRSWHDNLGCPGRDKLVIITVPYKDFQGSVQVGHLVAAKSVSKEVVSIFVEIFDNDFRINKMQPIDAYDGDDQASMEDNNTTAFNCRLKTGSKGLSAHSYGTAIDINPVQNPYVKDGSILPGSGKDFAGFDGRKGDKVGVIVKNGVVDTAFKRQKWKWGGSWRTLKDYQHFSKNGE